MLDTLSLDLRLSLRRLNRSPTFAITAILSLALGLAAALTMVGTVDTLLFRPPSAMREPERVVAVGPWVNFERTTYPDFVDLRDGARSFQALGAFAIWQYTARVGTDAVPARGMLASASLLPLLGTSPALGRVFTAREDRPGAAPVALVGHAFWLQHFDGDTHAVGRTFRLAERTFTIIGVLPVAFTAPDLSPIDLVLPITNAPWFGGVEALTNRNFSWVRIVGRLARNVSVVQAGAEATAIYRNANIGVSAHDQANLAREVVAVRPLVVARRDPSSPSVKLSLWLTLLAGAVLLIACANVSALFLARAVRERRELAIRAALGGSRWRLANHLLVEIAVLTVGGALLALLLAQRAGAVVARTLLANVVAVPPLDARTVLAASAIALTTLIIAAATPVARMLMLDPRGDLAANAHTVIGGHRRVLRGVLIVQLGLGTVLAAEAALFATSLRNATRVDLGVDLDRLLVADVDLHAAGIPEAQAEQAARRALDAVSRITGVQVAGMTNAATLPGYIIFEISVPGRDSLPGVPAGGVQSVNAVTAGYLDALEIRVLKGRTFSDADVTAHKPVAVVSERFAQVHWPGGTALGECVFLGRSTNPRRQCAQVIGVVSDRRDGPLSSRGVSEVYVPLASPLFGAALGGLHSVGNVFTGREMAIRVAGDPSRALPQVRAALLEALPTLTSVRVRTGNEYVERLLRTWRLGAGVLGVFGAIALLLGAVGVFGVSSHVVAQRTRELGIRGALGARPVDLASLVAREAIGLAGAGVVIGIVGALGATRVTRALAFGVSPLDPRIHVVAGITLIATTLLAAIVPARRAAAADPAIALRAD